jgi:hypothetical protein
MVRSLRGIVLGVGFVGRDDRIGDMSERLCLDISEEMRDILRKLDLL